MIYIIYLIIAAAVVFFSNKAALYVDLLEKNTKLSGAFVGGVLLSTVTSLPELFTSISATVLIHQPGLCIGNILGSNLFNLSILAILMLIWFKSFGKAKISRSHFFVAFYVLLMYLIIGLNYLHVLTFNMFTVSSTSILIVIFYIFGVRHLTGHQEALLPEVAPEIALESKSTLTVKQIVIRFIFTGIFIIILSILITYVTDIISAKLNLGSGLAGALLLGIATSLPEVSSTISLFYMKSFNIGIGNIVGSNLFNFVILSITDILYVGNSIYDFSDPKSINLLFFGLIGTLFVLALLRFKNMFTRIVCPICIFACYLAFLLV